MDENKRQEYKQESTKMVVPQFFKEISIGGNTKEFLISRLLESDIRFNEYAETLFTHPAFSPKGKVETVKLFKVRPSDLNMTNPCSFRDLITQASRFDLKLCPLSLAAYLRLEYLDQHEGPYLTIASARPEPDENYPCGFYLRNTNGSLWLRGYRATDFCEWPADNEFVFHS